LRAVQRLKALARQNRLVRVSVAKGRVVIETSLVLYRRANLVPMLFSREPHRQLQEVEEMVKLAK
ncbi:MAG: hypothetical protein J6Y80_00970, partial [Victivallales bacterium]|nr:hypothetical protein [Victivallales bacterium]